jgi:hypothetical protein
MSGISRRTQGRILAVAFAGTMSVASLAFGIGPASASTVSATYSCSAATPVGQVTYSGTADFTGTTPATVAPGTTVSMTGFQASMSVPGSLLDEAYGYGVRTATAKVTAFDIDATDATPGTLDAVKKPITVGHLKLLSSGNPTLNGRVPAKAAKIKGWVAGKAGTMSFSPGNAAIDFKSNLGSLAVQCTPSAPVPAISTTTVG